MAEFDPIDDLIGKVLTQEATLVEQNQLNQWLDENEANRIYYAQLKMIFERAAASSVKIKFDENEAWQKVKSNIHREQHAGYSISKYIIRMAAGIAFIAMVSYFAYQWMRPVVQTLTVMTDKKIKQNTLPDGSVKEVPKGTTAADIARGGDLPREPRPESRLIGQLGPDHLDRDQSTAERAREEHLAHSAGSQAAEQAVRPDRRRVRRPQLRYHAAIASAGTVTDRAPWGFG